MARPRTGQLILRPSGWYARVWTTIDGERVRVCRALETKNQLVAKRKLERMLAAEGAGHVDVRRPETFQEASVRVYEQRRRDGIGDPDEDLSSLRRHVFPVIGDMPVTAVESTDVNSVLDHVKSLDLSRETVAHVRQRISNVYSALRRDDKTIKRNPVEGASMPKFPDAVVKERQVLTDAELAVYLGWEHPEERFRSAVRERQVMACVARMFGGLRTGDLHALEWSAFDCERGGFEWGYAPRKKTRRPQLLEVPELLRPFLRDHWERAGRPMTGLLFPARRVGSRGDRVGQQRIGVSHAAAFRRDLRRAFEHAQSVDVEAPKPGTRRWRELFDETPHTLPVDFHSWRRAFAQALADADVTAQQAIALTGHSDMAVHARYLKSAGKMRRVPENALPQITVHTPPQRDARSSAEPSSKQRAHRLGRVRGNVAETPGSDPGPAGEGVEQSPTMSPGAAVGGALLSRRSQVRSLVGARKDFNELADRSDGEKAPPLPFEPEPDTGVHSRVPAGGMLGLLRAADSALTAGDVPRARELIAAAIRSAELDAKPDRALR